MFDLVPLKTKVGDGLIIAICYRRDNEKAIMKIVLSEDGSHEQIELPENLVIHSQFPNIDLRDVCYVAGPYGSGKSTYCENYIREFINVMPQKDIYLISRIDNDQAFRGLLEDGVMTQVELTADIIDDPIDCKEELDNSLIIFDDFELLHKGIQKSVEITIKDCILNGRDQSGEGRDIYAIITGHQICDGHRTRDIINESSSITFFPRAGGLKGIKRILDVHCGFEKEVISRILNLPSRWVTVYKRYPMWIMWESGVMIPHRF